MFNQNNPLSINDIPVHILEPLQVKVERPWKERLFTRPWKPFQKFKFNFVDVLEDDKIIQKDNGLFMSAKTWDKLNKTIKDKNNG